MLTEDAAEAAEEEKANRRRNIISVVVDMVVSCLGWV